MKIRELSLYAGDVELSTVLRFFSVACGGLMDAIEQRGGVEGGEHISTSIDFEAELPLRLNLTFSVADGGFDVHDASIEMRIATLAPLGHG